MKTVEQQVGDLMATLPYLHVSEGGVKGFEKRLRLAMLEVSRDQRHACAEAIMAGTTPDKNNPWMIDKDDAHGAVMNAEIKR